MKKILPFIFLWLLVTTAGSLIFSHPAQAETIIQRMLDNVSYSGLTALPAEGPEPIVGRIIQAFLSIFGVLFLALMIFGGYKWMIAQGREEEVKKGKDIIRSAIIGLGIVLLSYAISLFVIARFYAATTG